MARVLSWAPVGRLCIDSWGWVSHGRICDLLALPFGSGSGHLLFGRSSVGSIECVGQNCIPFSLVVMSAGATSFADGIVEASTDFLLYSSIRGKT